MPLMMDNDMDIDDLFGDGAVLPMQSRPPSKELHQRVDELRGGGCCSSIAWSKWGSIASITASGTSLELRNLRINPKDGSWALSEAFVTPALVPHLDGGPLKHLMWSPTGSELAVIDSAGRVAVLSLFSSINKPSLSRLFHSDPIDDLHRVVGCYWLNLAPFPPNRPQLIQHGPAVKDGSGYRYESSNIHTFGPHHPNHQKSAFVCVTSSGTLRVLYPQQLQNTAKWFEAQTELESVTSSDDLLTHAAICSDKNGTLLIAFATSSKQLRAVRAVVDWGLSPKSDKANIQDRPLNVTVKTRHLAVTSWLHNVPGDTLNASHLESTMTQLSQLGFLPPCADASGRVTSATIVTVRSHLPVSTNHYNQDVYTTVDRWEIRESPQTVHPAFEALSSRRNSIVTPPGSATFWKKLEGFTVNKIAISLQVVNHGRVVFIAYSDGSVEYRDRTTLAETWTDGDTDRLWHPSQMGFSYHDDDQCLQAILSPSWCSIVQTNNDGKIVWRQLQHVGEIGSSLDDAHYVGALSALALTCVSAVTVHVNFDDILATVNKHAKGSFSYDWLIETVRILKVNVDYSEEKHFDVLIRNTPIQLFLSIQQSLGFRGEFSPRTFEGKFAWIVLTLRSIVVHVTMAANVKVKGQNGEQSSPLEDPEVISTLSGSVRWTLDLISWITDTLLTLPSTLPATIDLTDASNIPLPELLQHLRATNNISLHLLLSSPPRGFLTAICRRLTHIDYIARKAIMHTASGQSNNTNSNAAQPPTPALTPALRAAYLQIATITSAAIIRAKTFEQTVISLTALIKTAYNTASPPLDKGRNAHEVKMMLGGALPDAFKPVIVEIFRPEGLLASIREEIDPAKLFFADFAMLEVDEDKESLERARRAGRTMDCFRKVWLANPKPLAGAVAAATGSNGTGNGNGNGNGASADGPANGTEHETKSSRWRRCTRCAAVMEDVLGHRQALQWLAMQQRRCFCSGYWNTLSAGKMVA